MDRSRLIRALQYEFRAPTLLQTALTHRSFSAQNNERLEFLGDSVLNCVIADELYRRFPKLAEGELSRARAIIVRQQSLFERAQALGIGEVLHLGEGEMKSGGQQRPSILADALEAIIGAVYVDAGFDAARDVVRRIFAPLLSDADPRVLGKDPKTLLQELLQGRRLNLPQYTVVATAGEAHRQWFTVECIVAQLDLRVQGEGTSRRAAEQCAAERAYQRLASSAA